MDTKQIEFLKSKSIESFLMCVEIFNKPTIAYRLEGSTFFLCNSWELMLKAKLLSDGDSIFYPSKEGKTRTLSLSDAVAKVITNENDPVRINLSVIISLRNTATHFIIPEFEIIYTPFLAFCVRSYANKIHDFFNVNISDYIKMSFLSLFVSNDVCSPSEILDKYGENIMNAFDSASNNLDEIIDKNGNTSIAEKVQFSVTRINNKSKADFTYYSSNNSKDPNIKYIERDKDYNKLYPLTHHNVANEVDDVIKKNNIAFTPIKKITTPQNNTQPHIFTSACLDVIIKKFKFKDNTEYCMYIEIGRNITYKYSRNIVTKIITMINDNPNIVVESKK